MAQRRLSFGIRAHLHVNDCYEFIIFKEGINKGGLA